MQQWEMILAIAGMFLLRLGVPLLLMAGLAWWFGRLDARWQAEARAEHAVDNWGRTGGETMPVAQPEVPCWIRRNCPDAQRAQCIAYQRSTLPCWLVRFRREGKLPRGCVGCDLFAAVQGRQPYPV